jgi:hypothetical protein
MENKPGSSHKGLKVNSYSISFKLKVIEYAKANSNHMAAKTHQVSQKVKGRIVTAMKIQTVLDIN